MRQSRDLLNEAVFCCERKKWIDKTDIVLLALSGGADSVFLFYVLLELRKSVPFEFHAIHINHLLRGKESDGDETFAAELAEIHRVKSSVYKVDVKQISNNTKKSIEMAARDARYDLIFKESRKIGATVIATAHNADDRAETALMRFISGSSVVGISGLRAVREYKNIKILRPIIDFFKADILEYLNHCNISFRFDSSNNNESFLRNKIRNRLIPYIEKDFNLNFKNNLIGTVDLFEQQADYLRCAVDKSSKEVLIRNDKIVVFNKTKLGSLHKCIISGIVINALYSLSDKNIRLASYHINNLVNQIGLVSKRIYVFPGNITAVADRRYLIIMNNNLYSEFIKKQNGLKKIEPNEKIFFELSCGLSI
ncbi:tRNA lysidine(34) synthetase TilS, partial [bacterium]|nr:tRNA lysidine(34) synthetase TilS [bacterium]